MDFLKSKNVRAMLLCILLSLIPPGIVAWRIFRQVGLNPSNDEVMILPLIARILGGQYSWSHFFRDTFLNGHSEIFPTLLHLAAAKWFDWNIDLLLAIGLLLFGLKAAAIFQACTLGLEGWRRWALLPLLSALVFSASQLSALEFEFVSIQMGLAYLGVAVAISWSARRGFALDGVALGGALLATWSSGGGLIVWPLLFLGWILGGRAKPKDYGIGAWSFVVAALPYAIFLIRPPRLDLYSWVEGHAPGIHLGLHSFFNHSFFLRVIGLPMTGDYNLEVAWWRGVIGVLLALAAIFRFIRSSKKSPALIASLLFLLYGILSVWQISLFREELARWYSCPALFFWIGLLGLAWRSREGWGRGWAWATFVVLAIFFLTSNLSFAGKSFYSESKNFKAESCIRDYLDAPTYCADSPFLWPPGQYPTFIRLASSLNRAGVNLFGPRQRRTLQGDFSLGKVKIVEEPRVPGFAWSPDSKAQGVPYDDVRPLNLFLHSPNWVEWSVQIPAAAQEAELRSAVAISPSAPEDSKADGMLFQVWIAEEAGAPKLYFSRLLGPPDREWVPFKLSLAPWRGKKIKIRLGSDPLANWGQDWGMWRFPEIRWIQEVPSNIGLETAKPANTDLAGNIPPASAGDFLFPAPLPKYWSQRNQSKGYPTYSYRPDVDLCLGEYGKILLKVAVPSRIYPRAARLTLQLEGESAFVREIDIPLLADGSVHEYSYDLALLELNPGVRLQGLEWRPIVWDKAIAGQSIAFEGIRLVSDKEGAACR